MSEAIKTPEPQNVSAEEQVAEASPQAEKKTPGRRPRLSFIERAQKESEELVKTLGGSLEMEGGRRTRSSARGTPTRPVATPPPAKKSRNSPASPKAATPRGRGRGRKLDTSVTPEPPESKEKAEVGAEKTESNEATVDEAAPEKSTGTPEKKEEEAKTNERSETNGPEKPDVEKGTNVPDKEELQATEKQVEAVVEEKSSLSADDKKSTDQVDASVLEPIKEKSSSQQAEETEHNIESKKLHEQAADPVVPVAAVDSPMEVDEQSNLGKASSKANEEAVGAEVIKVPELATDPPVVLIEPTVAEKIEAAPVQPAVVKQPTPEPMDVDSSSKSSDVVECTDVVDKAEETVQITSNDVKSTNSHVGISVFDEKAVDVPATPAPENNLKSEINANVTANDIPAVKSIVEPVAAGEPHVDNNKNGNDVDKQKLAAAASQLNVA